MIRAGYCTGCGDKVWRFATLQRDAWGLAAGTEFLLWPKPDSLYAKVETPTGYAPGIAYCANCAPPAGAPGPILDGAPVVGYESALERYSDWYQPIRQPFYAAWLRDALFLEGVEIDRLLALWEKDRAWTP